MGVVGKWRLTFSQKRDRLTVPSETKWRATGNGGTRGALLELLEGTFLFQGAPEAAQAPSPTPGRSAGAAAKGEVIYDPRHFQRCLGVVLEGSVQVSKGALIMSVLKRGDLFGAAALFYQRPDYATTLTARSPCRLLLFPQALVEEWMSAGPRWGGAM